MSESFDYIIIGAGSSGCTLAHRLSEHASVLLLEKGGTDSSAAIHDPAAVLGAIFASPDISVPYLTEPQDYLTQPGSPDPGRVVGVHRGIVRGGCSSINGMIYIRGNRRDYDHWAQLGNQRWSYDDLLPYFKRSENHAEGESRYHGVGGPLDVRKVPNPSNVARAFVEAAANHGRFPKSRIDGDVNGEQQEDVATINDVNVTPAGKRASAAVAFLDSIRDRKTLTVRTGTQVARIVIEDGRATGVEVQEGGGVTRYHADGEVILSAGAFESPKLLMLSGIGPASHLREHQIEVVRDLPGVGQNLHDHVQILLYVLSPAGSDPGTSNYIAEAGLFTNTRGATDQSPDLEYHFLAGMAGLPIDAATQENFLICPALIQPESRGTVRLRSSDPTAPPVVDPRYLEQPADVEVLTRGIELARELIDTAPLSDFSGGGPLFAMSPDPEDPVNKPPVRLDVPAQGREGLEQFVRSTCTTVWHPVGTCAMGTGPEAVVDPSLRVTGVEGLRVVDASIMPRTTSGNTHAPSVMIAEKAADLIAP